MIRVAQLLEQAFPTSPPIGGLLVGQGAANHAVLRCKREFTKASMQKKKKKENNDATKLI